MIPTDDTVAIHAHVTYCLNNLIHKICQEGADLGFQLSDKQTNRFVVWN